jgi:hypothetical protein
MRFSRQEVREVSEVSEVSEVKLEIKCVCVIV